MASGGFLDTVASRLSSMFPSERAREDADETEHRVRVATAALMYRVIDADGKVLEEERERLAELLAETYGLNAVEVVCLAKSGEKADHGATDLYEHTSVLRRELEMEDRTKLVERLFELAFADETLHEGEDATVRRISELLGIDQRDRVLARRDVAERHGKSPLPEAE